MPHRLVTLYEARNETLREVFASRTRRLVHSLEAAHARRRPKAMAHWKPEHRVSYRGISYAVERGRAAEFLRSWKKHLANGWTVL